MRRALSAFVILAASTSAQATPLYNVADLGTSFQYQIAADGTIQGVTTANGSTTYAFDKAPVTKINDLVDGGSHADSFTVFTLQDGSHRVGYGFDYGGGLSGSAHYAIDYPTFEPWSNGWFTGPGQSPVLDLNTHGQAVGFSDFNSGPGTYAAFSDPNGATHGFNAAVVDNLNNYINTIPGVTLTTAIQIDDAGRILADGSDGDTYLLTPTALGDPATVPEPSTSLFVALVGGGIAIRGWVRTRNRPGTKRTV